MRAQLSTEEAARTALATQPGLSAVKKMIASLQKNMLRKGRKEGRREGGRVGGRERLRDREREEQEITLLRSPCHLLGSSCCHSVAGLFLFVVVQSKCISHPYLQVTGFSGSVSS